MSPKNDLCTWVSEQLPTYVDGELGPAESRAVSNHLDGCSRCGEAAAAERSLVADCIHELVAEEPAADLAGRIVAATKSLDEQPVPAPVNRSLLSWQSAAAAILVLIIGAVVISVDPDPGSDEIAFRKPAPASDIAAPPPVEERIDGGSGLTVEEAHRDVEAEAVADSAPVTTSILRGDVDSDGDFDFADLVLLGHILQNPERARDLASCAAAGDIDDDNELTPNDQVAFVAFINRAGAEQAAYGAVPRYMEYSPESGLPCSTVACP